MVDGARAVAIACSCLALALLPNHCQVLGFQLAPPLPTSHAPLATVPVSDSHPTNAWTTSCVRPLSSGYGASSFACPATTEGVSSSQDTGLAIRVPSTQDLFQLGLDSILPEGTSALVCQVEGVVQGAALVGPTTSNLTRRLQVIDKGLPQAALRMLLDSMLAKLMNKGTRIGQVEVLLEVPGPGEELFREYGFVPGVTPKLMVGSKNEALEAISARADKDPQDAVLLNIKGRLQQDCGEPEAAIDTYMKAISVSPGQSDVFCCLGSAYHSLGQHQMAFASYQQAIDINPSDYSTYLRLGYLYEELAVGKYEEAGDHAIQCLEYYLKTSGKEDTDVLTRLGNMYIRRLSPDEAVKCFERALDVDPGLSNVWFNLGNAHLKLQQNEEAKRCLKKAQELEPSIAGVKMLLASLDSSDVGLSNEDRLQYSRDLFDYYAETYDDHMRTKLLYTGPRLLRTMVKDHFNATFVQLPEVEQDSLGGDVLTYLNTSLAILDLGCGTGLCGTWFADYTKHSVGVDISQKMIDMATKRGCYNELKCNDIASFLQQEAVRLKNGETVSELEGGYDLVLSAETLQYLGALEGPMKGVATVLKPGGLFAFTTERLTGEALELATAKGGMLLREGTYGYCKEYMEGALKGAGLELLEMTETSTRVERGEPLPAFIGLAQKPMP